MKFLHNSTVAVACYACIASGVASAQNVAKPYPAVFGGAATATPKKGPTVDFAVEAVDAYDDNLLADIAGSPATNAVQASGFYSVLAPSVTVDYRPGHAHLVANGNSNFRYYNDLNQVLAVGNSAAIGLDAPLNRKTGIFLNQAVGYAPAYLHGLFATVGASGPGAPIDSASNYAVDAGRSLSSSTTARLNRTVTAKVELSAEASYRRTDFIDGAPPGYFDLKGYDLGTVMRYSMSRHWKVRVAYTHHDTRYSSDYHPLEDNVDIGAEFSRPLSSLRRTTFGFSLRPSMARGVATTPELATQDRQYRIGGDVAVSHQLTRTWYIGGSARRGLTYIESVARPVLANAATVEARGFLNRRTDVSMSAGYTTGELALTGTPPPFSTYTGLARLRFAFARNLAVFGEYLYYYYQFNRDFPLPLGVPSALTRNGVRVGVTLWVPVGRK